MDETTEDKQPLRRLGRPPKAKPEVAPMVEQDSPAQALALRIWAGQSPDVSVIERVARIANGLKAQNMDLNITLPHPDAGRYLEAHK